MLLQLVSSPDQLLHFKISIDGCLLLCRQFSRVPCVDLPTHPGGGLHEICLRFEAAIDGPDVGPDPAREVMLQKGACVGVQHDQVWLGIADLTLDAQR